MPRRDDDRGRQRAASLATLLLVLILALPAMGQSRDPAYPPGRDPGGVPVAVFADGVDYTDGRTAARLARDGEGDVIAWDFADSDTRPFGATDPRLLRFLDLAMTARVIVARSPADDPARAARLTAFAVRTPARIILTWDTGPGRPDWLVFLEGVRRFPDRLFVVACTGPAPETRTLANLIMAGAAGSGCDVAVTGDGNTAPGFDLAASRAAALATDALSVRPAMTAADLKQDLVARCADGCPVGRTQPR